MQVTKMNLLDEIRSLRSRLQKATTCSVCCSPVVHHCADEGTQSYEAICEGTEILSLCDDLEKAVEALTTLPYLDTDPAYEGIRVLLKQWDVF